MSDYIGKLRDLLLAKSKSGTLRGLLDSVYDSALRGAEAYGSANSPMAPQHAAGLLGTIADFTPVVGDVKSAYEGVQAAREGDWAGAGFGMLGALPFVPGMAGVMKSGDFLKKNPDFASSAISKDGELIPGYHATNKEFTEFDPSKSRNNAVYFSTKPEIVEGMQYGSGEGGRTIASYVNLKNPAPYKTYEELRKKYGTRSVVDELKKLGYDGVDVEPRTGFFMAFDGKQIKSAISD